MSNEPHISAIMAVRNAEKTLSRAVHSLLAQSLPPREILLILNGCSDGSAALAQQLARQHSSLRLFESAPAGGVALAAQIGCQAAKYPLLARMDADDYSHPQRLEFQFATLQEKDADLVTCQIENQNSLGAGLDRFTSWVNTLLKPEDFRRERFIESPVDQPGVLMTKTAYQKAGGYRVEDGPEDYDLWLRMIEKQARFFQAIEARLAWHDSSQRLTRSHPDYAESRMAATKARYLANLDRVQQEGVAIAGSGPIGRRLAKLLKNEKTTIHGFFDVDPSKIGNTILGLPVYGPHKLGHTFRRSVLLGCVGRGGREKVRKFAQMKGYEEGLDFFACC